MESIIRPCILDAIIYHVTYACAYGVGGAIGDGITHK